MNTSKIIELINNYITPEDKPSVNVGLTSYKYKGPICDDVGFENHIGECWNSTLWEILLFSDDLKDFFQPIIYTLNTNSLSSLILSKLVSSNNVTESTRYISDKLAKHLILIKKRFIEHYNYLSNRNRRNNTTRKLAFNYKRRHSIVCGIGSAKHAINIFRGESNKYKSGLDSASVKDLITYILRIFTAPFKIETVTRTLKYNENDIKAFILTANVYKLDTSIYTYSGKTHMLGIL